MTLLVKRAMSSSSLNNKDASGFLHNSVFFILGNKRIDVVSMQARSLTVRGHDDKRIPVFDNLFKRFLLGADVKDLKIAVIRIRSASGNSLYDLFGVYPQKILERTDGSVEYTLNCDYIKALGGNQLCLTLTEQG